MDSKQSSWKGSLLLLLVLNLLLCKNVAASPACAGGAANCRLSLQDLFTRAVALSDNIYKVAEDTFRGFQKTYATGREFISRAINSCHTSTIPTPADKDQALNTESGTLLNTVRGLLRSWEDPLQHLTTTVRDMKEFPADMIRRVQEIEYKTHQLREGMEKIIKQVEPGVINDDIFAAWSGLSSLQKGDKNSHLVGFYNLFHCLRRDTNKVDNYLKILKCKVVHEGSC
ncbi:prolactin-like isoform X3 [Castor canadensis]|uniref:Prolactin-like isoform X3 n=1 Tax=Castor canadensis TaxID=51338 RepID=A0AC58N8F0_CASCN